MPKKINLTGAEIKDFQIFAEQNGIVMKKFFFDNIRISAR